MVLTATARVRCSGTYHRISVTDRGAIVLHDHPKEAIRAEEALIALGGEQCRCLQVLKAWRRQDIKKVPQKLQGALRAAREKSRGRWAKPKWDRLQPGAPPLLQYKRSMAKIKSIVSALLEECRYRKSKSTWAGGLHYLDCRILFPSSHFSSPPTPTIEGYAKKVWSSNGKWTGNNSYIHVEVKPSWYTRVFKRGLGVVDGHFVVDIVAETKKEIIVLAGQQGRGLKIYPAKAAIAKTAEGKYRLRWAK